MVSRLAQIVFPLAALYLLGVLVQVFLAGLGAFAATSYDAHQGFGFALGIASLVLLALVVAGRLSVRMMTLAGLLFVLNVLQSVLANIDVEEIAALHTVNALAIVFVAHALMQRARAYERAKMAA
jgi:hypothetical protein